MSVSQGIKTLIFCEVDYDGFFAGLLVESVYYQQPDHTGRYIFYNNKQVSILEITPQQVIAPPPIPAPISFSGDYLAAAPKLKL